MIENFTDFWVCYVTEHRAPVNRWLHFVGTNLTIMAALGFVFTEKLWFLLAMPIAGYAFAWVGHFFVEHNKPLTFRHPLWSLRADFQFCAWMWLGRMDREAAAVGEKSRK
jgi:hypothetical protein